MGRVAEKTPALPQPRYDYVLNKQKKMDSVQTGNAESSNNYLRVRHMNSLSCHYWQ